MARKFQDVEEAKIYAKSFLQWIYTALVKSPKKTKETNMLIKSVRDLDAAIGYIIKHYESKIQELETKE